MEKDSKELWSINRMEERKMTEKEKQKNKGIILWNKRDYIVTPYPHSSSCVDVIDAKQTSNSGKFSKST